MLVLYGERLVRAANRAHVPAGGGDFLQAAHATGLKYLIYDTSRTPSNGVNEGPVQLDRPLDPGARPLPGEPVLQRQHAGAVGRGRQLPLSGGGFGHVSTYAQLLDRESNVMLRYLLQGHNRPLMFHEPNLRTYSAGKSLLGDLIDATLAKYSNLVTVPLVSPTQDVLGQKQASRMAYDAAFKSGAVTASIVPNTSVTMSAASGLAGTVTGSVTGRRGQPLASSIASTPRFVVVAGEQGPRRGRCRVHPGRVGVHAQTRLIEIDVAAAGH
jgi:hypothetical protein